MAEHTKLPWYYCGEGNTICECGYIFGDDGDVYVAKVLNLDDGIDPVASAKTRIANIDFIIEACNYYENLKEQVNRLSEYIMLNVPGEPYDMAVVTDTAIRIMREYQHRISNLTASVMHCHGEEVRNRITLDKLHEAERKLDEAKESFGRIRKFPSACGDWYSDWYRMVADEALKKLES